MMTVPEIIPWFGQGYAPEWEADSILAWQASVASGYDAENYDEYGQPLANVWKVPGMTVLFADRAYDVNSPAEALTAR